MAMFIILKVGELMSNTRKHKILGKFKNKVHVKIPNSIEKFWRRWNFDIGELRKLRIEKLNRILNNDTKDAMRGV